MTLQGRELTPREREVADVLVTGIRNQEVGERFGISVRTVEVHRARILEKLGAHSVTEVAHLQAEQKLRALVADLRAILITPEGKAAFDKVCKRHGVIL